MAVKPYDTCCALPFLVNKCRANRARSVFVITTASLPYLILGISVTEPIKAKEFLLEMLKDGEMLSSDCEERLEAAGFKKSTIKKAKKKAGVISKKKGFLWYWSLPMGDIPRE